MNAAPREADCAGFSMLEILCAIVILGVGLTGITRGITGALHTSKDSEWQTQAVLLATGRMEEIRAEGSITAGDDEGDFDEPFASWSWHEKVEETDIDGLYDVTVTVTREIDGADVQFYELKTLLFEAPYTPTSDETSSGAEDSTGSASRQRPPTGW